MVYKQNINFNLKNYTLSIYLVGFASCTTHSVQKHTNNKKLNSYAV